MEYGYFNIMKPVGPAVRDEASSGEAGQTDFYQAAFHKKRALPQWRTLFLFPLRKIDNH
jgi:hypothetical protein